MAVLTGLDNIEASNNTFGDWLARTNELSRLMREEVVTAGVDSWGNTDGNARLNGEFVANTLIAFDELRGGNLFANSSVDNSANLIITTNTIFQVTTSNDITTSCEIVIIEANLQVDTDSLFLGNVQAQSTIQFANNDSAVEFKGANQDFIWLSTDSVATIRTNSDGSLEFNADVNANSGNVSSIELKVDSLDVASFTEGGDVAFYSANGSEQRLYWDATNLVLGVNTADPQDNVALDVVGNTHTTDLNVAHQTTSGNVVVNDELRGNNTLTITTNAEFTALADQVLIRNDLFVEGDAQVTSNLTVNTDSTFVGNIEVQTDSLFIGNVEAQSTIEFTKGSSTLEFAGANQTFIWDATNTQSTIRTNANGSLIIDADKTNNGANTSRLDLRVDNKNSVRVEDDHVAFYNEAGTLKRLYWDAANTALSINKASPAAGVKLDVSGNTQTTDLVVANETTSGNVIVKNQLRGDTTLTITTDTEFTSDVSQVLIRNDLFVNGDVQISSNLTVNTDSTFVGDIDVQTDSLLRGAVEAQSTIQFTGNDSTLEFVGANQTFIWDSTESTIRTNADGSLIIDADKTANGVSTSRIDLRVDDNNSIRIEDDHVAFYNQTGTAKRLYWDAANLALSVNAASPGVGLALDVVGNTQTTDLVVTGETTSGNVVVTDELRGDTTLSITTNATFSGANTVVQNDLYVDQELTANVLIVNTEIQGVANLSIVSNTDFSQSVTMASNLSVDGVLTINTLDYVLVPDDYNNLIPNQTTGRTLGNTTNRWDGFFRDVSVDNDLTVGGDASITGNVGITDTLTVQNLTVPGDGILQLPSDVEFTGVTTFEDITIFGVADFATANLVVGGLTTNNAGLIGAGGSVNTTGETVIDSFDKTDSKGFKYIVHGDTSGDDSDASTAYAIEINCSHNNSTVFFTRFGEVSNNFDAVLTPRINGNNVELVAECPSANGTNIHNFNILRIETR